MTALIASQSNPDIQKSHAYAPPRASTQCGKYIMGPAGNISPF